MDEAGAVELRERFVLTSAKRAERPDLAFCVVAIDGENARQVFETCAGRSETQPQLEIERDVQVLTNELVQSVEGSTTNEDRRLHEWARLRVEPLPAGPMSNVMAQDKAVATEHDCVAVYDVDARVRAKATDDCLERVDTEQRVVAVQPADDLTARADKCLVERMRLTAVGLNLPAYERRSTFEDGERAVCGAAVRNDLLDVRVRLGGDRRDAVTEKAALVERRRQDRDERRPAGSCGLAVSVCSGYAAGSIRHPLPFLRRAAQPSAPARRRSAAARLGDNRRASGRTRQRRRPARGSRRRGPAAPTHEASGLARPASPGTVCARIHPHRRYAAGCDRPGRGVARPDRGRGQSAWSTRCPSGGRASRLADRRLARARPPPNPDDAARASLCRHADV